MILSRLPIPKKSQNIDDVPRSTDHCLYVQQFNDDYKYPAHTTGLGLLAILEGKAKFTVNEEHIYLDGNSFVFLNKGSQLSIKGEEKGTFIILYFNSVLSEIITNSLFDDDDKQKQARNMADYHDYSLVEYIHYSNASLKGFLPLLIDLGSSCASFHALKADMLIRTILNNVIQENYSAIQVSSKLGVIKKSTRVSLYKRLSVTKAWINQNYASSISVQHMADIAMLNLHHFLRIFKKTFGLTPHQYLTEIRIAQAQVLLRETDQSVSSICHAVGFDSLSSFSHLFKTKTGVSPKLYRLTCLNQ